MRILKGNRTPALLVIASMLALLVAACGGGGGGGSSGSTSFTVVGYQMGGARQGVTLPLATASATVSTIPGNMDWPQYATTDGTNLYVTDCGSYNDVFKIEIATGQSSVIAGSAVSGYADGPGTTALLNCPAGITTDGNSLFVVDSSNNNIRRITPVSGSLANMSNANAVVTTLAGQSAVLGANDGTGSAATFSLANGITTDGRALYVADAGNNKIRMIAPTGGATLDNMTSAVAVVTSLTGITNAPMASGVADGSAATATFNSPVDITTDGTNLYVADSANHEIRMIASGQVSTLAGNGTTGALDGTGTAATFFWPYGITTDGTNLYVTDANNKVRMIAPAGGVTLASMTSATAQVTSITGPANLTVASGVTDGAAAGALFNNPNGFITDGKSLYVMDSSNGLVRKVQ